MEPILRSPIRGLADLMTLDTLKVAPVLRPWESVYSQLTRYFKSEESRLAMSFQSKYLGMSPFECPSLFTILPFIEYEYGVWHPIGGCNALVTAMAEACSRLGARIETASPVSRVMFEGQRACGVVVHGEERRFDHVVVNADATWAMKNLIPANLRRGDQQDAALDAKRYSCSTFMLYLGMEGEVDLPHHTIYTSTKYRQNLADIGEGRLSDDASFYVCNPSRIDPTLAPKGDSALYVLLPTANTKAAADGAPIDWKKEAPRVREETLHRLSTVMGIPDAARRVKAEIMFTPDDWRAQNINHGATFNLAHNITQMLHWRPQHKLRQPLDRRRRHPPGLGPARDLPRQRDHEPPALRRVRREEPARRAARAARRRSASPRTRRHAGGRVRRRRGRSPSGLHATSKARVGPPSRTFAMCGWFITASAWRSCSKRAITLRESMPA